jgi:hypothetical protein
MKAGPFLNYEAYGVKRLEHTGLTVELSGARADV